MPKVIFNYHSLDEVKININFFNENDLINDDDIQITELPGILNLCLLKFIAKFFKEKELEKIKQREIKEIIENLNNGIELTENIKDNIKIILSEYGNNILEYSKYVKEKVNKNNLDSLINILHDKKAEIIKYWKSLLKYKSYIQFFEKEITNDLKSSIFDY